MVDSLISGNSATSGAGIYKADGTLTVANSLVSGNSSTTGGGIYNAGSTLIVTNSTISNNTFTQESGGGIYNIDGTVTVVNSTISGNSGPALGLGGAGIIANRGTLRVANSTIFNNQAGGVGSAILSANATTTVTNSTIAGNGGGIFVFMGGTVTLTNTLLAANGGANCYGGVVDDGHNLDDDTTCAFGSGSISNPSGGAGLDPSGLQNNGGPTQTVALLVTSPAINAGDNAACAASGAGQPNGVDQRWALRPSLSEGNCDIGAYEYGASTQGRVPTLATVSPATTAVVASDAGDLELTINGTGFVYWLTTATLNGMALATTVVSPTALTVSVPAALRATAGSYPLAVTTNAQRLEHSNTLNFIVTNPVPTLTSLGTTQVEAGSDALQLTLSGSGFVPGSQITFDGTVLTPSTVSADELTVTIPAAALVTARTALVAVVNPGPGGGTSAPLSFVIAALASPSPSPAAVSIAPEELVFGERVIGSTGAAQPVALTNTGGSSLALGAVAISGGQAGDFALAYNTCVGSLLPGTACTVGVTFVPAATGSRSATLTFENSAAGSPYSIDLSGTGVAIPTSPSPSPAAVDLTPTTLSFGNQGVGTPSMPQQVALTNTGGSPLAIAGVGLGGTNSGDFTLAYNTCVGSLSPGASCVVGVAFAPGMAGSKSASLAITDSAAGSPHTVALTGLGVAPSPSPSPGPPLASVAPVSVDFGPQAVGTTATVRPVTLTNTGGSPLAVGAIALAGNNTSDFTLAFTTCAGSLAPNAGCVVGVAFAPTAAGARTATLTIVSSAAGSPHGVALSGTGVAAPSPSPSPTVEHFTVTASATGPGTVNPVGASTHDAGSQAAYTASPTGNAVFLGWTLDGAFVGQAPTLTLTVSGNRTLVAAFAARPAFVDIAPSDPDYQAITTLAALGIINPNGVNGSGQFQPEQGVKRAEVAAFIARVFGWQTEFHANNFPDQCDPQGQGCIDAELWNTIAALADYSIVGGYTDTATCAASGTSAPCYLPRDPVLRVQVVSVVARAFTKAPGVRTTGYWDRLPGDPAQYTNVPDAGSQRSDLTTYTAHAGVVPGASAGTFPDPNGPATRRFIIQVLYRAYVAQFGTDLVP